MCAGRMPATSSFLLAALLFIIGFAAPVPAAAQVRLRDLVEVGGVRGNQLVGYGLVLGLQNTGDNLSNAIFTQQAIYNMMARMGVNITGQTLQTRNAATVIVTAMLPPFARQGTPIDVQVASMGDAKSLSGGILMVTPMLGADGEVYAVAQGPVVIGGLAVNGRAQSVRSGVQTSGSIPGGAIVEREVPNTFDDLTVVHLALRQPDFTTARRLAQAINARLGGDYAQAPDLGTVDVRVPEVYAHRVTDMMADLEQIEIPADEPARIVVDISSGTIVIGADVRLDAVAVTHGNLTVRITETPQVSQPAPFSNGQTAIVPRTRIGIDNQSDKKLRLLPHSASLGDLVRGLNALGLGPRDLIQVLTALKAAGALHAEMKFL